MDTLDNRAGPPRTFDPTLVRRRLARAQQSGFANVLVERAAADALDRLSLILRAFPDALDLGTPSPDFAASLAKARPATWIVRAAPIDEEAAGSQALCVADPEALPFGAMRFDLVVSLLALQAANDVPGALVQIRRSLRPDGLFLGCMLGGRTLSELRACLTQAESEIEGGISPRVAPFADVRDMGGLLQRAGFALPVADVDMLTLRYVDAFALMLDLRAMGLTNALNDRVRRPTRRTTLVRAAELYAERFSDADGRVRATFELIWMAGWVPHESQQVPLKPGSAKARLADALAVPRGRDQS